MRPMVIYSHRIRVLLQAQCLEGNPRNEEQGLEKSGALQSVPVAWLGLLISITQEV